MNAAALTPVLWLLTGFAWLSFLVLSRAAFHGVRIGALTERAFIAFVLAMLGTVGSVLRYNTDSGFSLMPMQAATVVFAVTILFVLLIPTAWLVMWLLGRLGEDL